MRPRETWEADSLGDTEVTSAENNSSVVLLVNFPNGDRWLFTGDAGILALRGAADYLDTWAGGARTCKYIQIPHHGSRKNVGPAILDRLVGPKVPRGQSTGKVAVVSAAGNDRTTRRGERRTHFSAVAL